MIPAEVTTLSFFFKAANIACCSRRWRAELRLMKTIMTIKPKNKMGIGLFMKASSVLICGGSSAANNNGNKSILFLKIK